MKSKREQELELEVETLKYMLYKQQQNSIEIR